MNQTGEKDTVKAADRVRMEYIEKQAEALSQDPLVLAQMLLEMRAPAFKPEVNAEAVDEDGVRIAQQVIDCIEKRGIAKRFPTRSTSTGKTPASSNTLPSAV